MKKSQTVPIPEETIEGKILFLRGKKVMLDRDLASLFKVETRVLNQAVRRNIRQKMGSDLESRIYLTCHV